MYKFNLKPIADVVKNFADTAVSASSQMRHDCEIVMDKTMTAIKQKDAEIAALKARLAGTVYDGTAQTLPPGNNDEWTWCVKTSHGFRGVATRDMLVVGDTWWPFPGGEE